MSTFTGSRCYRLAAVALAAFIVWQIVSHFWLDRNAEQLTLTAPVAQRGAPGKQFSYDSQAADRPAAVQVDVFYEALCPDSMNFIVDQLAPACEQLHEDVLHITLVPYGKATTQYHSRPDARPGDPPPVTFSCQHGAEECWANKVHACGIRHAASQAQAVRFVTCLMKRYRKVREKAQDCADSTGLQWRQLAVCAEDEAINMDMERYGNMTHSLNPRVTFIPTITVDGSQKHQGELFSNLISFVCTAYEARAGARASGCP